MAEPRGLLEREEVVLLVVILGGIALLTALFIVFRSTSETVSGLPLASQVLAFPTVD